ncbi:MAG TPA: HlyD family efflux transporter periplasmic adaptor subunit, partial [Firmicutes bacterium]|nr:HlyD family efflux transporter periplasmic adaptor subunit [Bacillota bacterium]
YESVRTQLQLAQSAYDETVARLDTAREMLDLRLEGARTEQIEQARAALRQTQAAYSLVLAGPRPETIEQAQAQYDIALETLKQAQMQLEYTQLFAPFDGVVLVKSAEPGEYLNPGSPVITLGQLDTVFLRAYVNETDLGRIKLDQIVEVTTDTYPGKIYRGRISYIGDEAEFTPKTVQTRAERVKLMYLVKIELDNSHRELKPGMPADCLIRFNL